MKSIRPTVTKVELHCIKCNSTSSHYMTNLEIYNKTSISKACEVCNEFTEWRLKGEADSK